jgi:outer membrane biogenesis lipoprotein LolB
MNKYKLSLLLGVASMLLLVGCSPQDMDAWNAQEKVRWNYHAQCARYHYDYYQCERMLDGGVKPENFIER